MKKVLILGASGSIGTQTIDVINRFSSDFELVGISVGNRTEIAYVLVSVSHQYKDTKI